MTGFRDRLTRLHPAWSLLLIAASICTALLAVSSQLYDLHLASTLAVCLLTLLWAHGVYDRARSSDPGDSQVHWISRLFIATEAGFVGLAAIMLTVGFEGLGSVFGGVPALVVIPYFVCLWLAAAALSRAEGGGKAASGATLGTFLFMVYWVIGVWSSGPD
ncbi:MAG: hypothetical protein EON89_01855 [Brevundimonas sp.]|nr:MAG: hypothetical protein EON89_01855 [Brevundimonas sp.]